jgi:hypothetical protein
MGQYFRLANLDKKELVSPHSLGTFMDAREQGCETGLALLILVGSGMGRGVGDFNTPTAVAESSERMEAQKVGKERLMPDVARIDASYMESVVLGRWAGDRVVFVGDYYEQGDVPSESATDADLYKVVEETFVDIGSLVVPYLEANR